MKTTNENVAGPVEPRDEYIVKLPIILTLYSILHIAMLVMGSLYQDDCPVEPHIPLFLILQGTFGLLSRAIGSIKYFIKKRDVFFIFLLVSTLLYVGEFIVFILGTFWVYKEAMPSYNSEDEKNYCHKGAYLFSFCYVSVMYCLVIFSATFLFCALILTYPHGIHKVAETKPWQMVVI